MHIKHKQYPCPTKMKITVKHMHYTITIPWALGDFLRLNTNGKLKERAKATGFKSLRINCWEINQVISKCQMDLLNKTCKKRSKTERKNITIKFEIFQIVWNQVSA